MTDKHNDYEFNKKQNDAYWKEQVKKDFPSKQHCRCRKCLYCTDGGRIYQALRKFYLTNAEMFIRTDDEFTSRLETDQEVTDRINRIKNREGLDMDALKRKRSILRPEIEQFWKDKDKLVFELYDDFNKRKAANANQ